MLLVADLYGALAVCLSDGRSGAGGLLHLPYSGGPTRSSDATDSTLSCFLLVLDRFVGEVFGNAVRLDEVQARVVAHALPAKDPGEPSASLVDLVKADLADRHIRCATQILTRADPFRIYFQPYDGRIYLSGSAVAAGSTTRRLSNGGRPR